MLLVRSLSLRDWRNFDDRTIGLGEGMTVLHGRNASGKTNVVEALQTLTSGHSFRRPRPAELVREGQGRALASARLEGDGRVIDVCCKVEGTRRHFERNGKRCHAADLPETMMSVLFCPDDLSLVKRGASHRRDELDDFGRQANRGYGRVLAAYERAVAQRNRLLREDVVDLGLLRVWDESVALCGAALLFARLRLFRRLSSHVRDIYERISGGERLDCTYVASVGSQEELAGLSKDELRDLILRQLEERRHDELRRCQTLVGPHRDDLGFTIGGRDARAFASQGQQRSVTLALKMAEVELSFEVVGTRPLLLLDDVMSELDERRSVALMDFVQGTIQSVVTTANVGNFPRELLDRATLVGIGEP